MRFSGPAARGGMALGAMLLSPTAAHAAEGGLSNFPYGALSTYSAFVPAPGTSGFYGYSLFMDAHSVRDANGDKVPGVSAEVVALAPRVLHTWEKSFLGWKMTSGALAEVLYANVKVPGADDDDLGPTLIGLEPLYFSKTAGAWTFFHGPLVYLPLGNYRADRLANSNLNYRSYTYLGSVTWLPTARFEASLNAEVEFKSENSETQYEAGPQASLTFGTGYKPFTDTRWDLGVSGYYTDGLADDEQHGRTVAGGGRTRRFALGPKLVFWPKPGTAIVAQWHHEVISENGTKGDLFWLQCAFPL